MRNSLLSAARVLPRQAFASSATRYQRRQVSWLCAIRQPRESEQLGLDAIRALSSALPAPELETLALRELQPGKLANALGGARTPARR